MTAILPDFIHTLLKAGVSKECVIVLVSMLPIVELRGAIPLALGMKFSLLQTYILAVLGNIIPVPLILLFLHPIFNMLGKVPIFNHFFEWIFQRTKDKGRIIERYGSLGLILFVATPLPVTGAWTGCIAAQLFGLRMRYAIPSIVIGVLIAGVIVSLGSAGIICSFSYLIRVLSGRGAAW